MNITNNNKRVEVRRAVKKMRARLGSRVRGVSSAFSAGGGFWVLGRAGAIRIPAVAWRRSALVRVRLHPLVV